MPLALWVEHYTAGRLRFKRWGHLDPISNYPSNRAIFCDYDRQSPVQARIPKINSTFRAMGLRYSALRISKSKRGWHYVFFVTSNLSPGARVAAEAILGDDPMRAAMNFARARNAGKMPKYWQQRWNIFYDYKLES
jgi:hypothetical protein